MTDSRNGRRFRIPASRHLTWDLMWFHRSVPLCAHDRRMDLSILHEARSRCAVRIAWPTLFLKAYALTAVQFAELRQTWYRWPWGHLYQHPHSVAILAVQRTIGTEPWLFWGRISAPECLPLPDLQRLVDRYTSDDVKLTFRQQLRLAHLPMLLRRTIWWWNLNIATKNRAKRLGTFFLSTISGRGAEIQLPPSVQTGCLTFGPLDENRSTRVTLAYDHRVMDGALVADVLQTMEQILNETLASELRAVATKPEIPAET